MSIAVFGFLATILLTTTAGAQSSLPQQGLQMNLPSQARARTVQDYANLMTLMLRCRPGAPIVPRRQVIDELRTGFMERHDRTVYVLPSVVAELFINRATGTWTIVRTGPQQQACVVADGQHAFWQEEL